MYTEPMILQTALTSGENHCFVGNYEVGAHYNVGNTIKEIL